MKWFRTSNPYVLIAPAVLITILLLGYGIVMAFLESIKYYNQPTLSVYRELFSDGIFITSILYSLRIAFISTILSILIGLVIVRSLYPMLKSKFPKLIAWMPMVFPHFVWGYMLFLLFSQTGYISSLLNGSGLLDRPDEFPILFKDSFGIGIIITYVWKEVPFVILMLLPVYEQLSNAQKELVYTLGGRRWDVFWHVERPYVFPVMLETFFIVFAFVVSAYEVPALLGATYPKMIPVISYDWFFGSDWTKQPYAFAAMFLLTIFIVLIVFMTYVFTRKGRIHLAQSSGSFHDLKAENSKYSRVLFFTMLGMTLLPILILVLTSFVQRWEYGELLPSSLTTRGWHEMLWHGPKFTEAIYTSLGISLLVLLLNLLIGLPAAKGLAFHIFQGKSVVETLLLSPILIPSIVIALGVHLTFIKLGIANHWTGVVIVHLLPTLPYTIKVMRAGFERIGKRQEEIAVSLGAGSWGVFRNVYLPQLIPSIRSVVFLVTVISLGQYFLTALIGGGEVNTMAILFFPYFQTTNDAVIASFSILFAMIPIAVWLLIEGALRFIIPKQPR
ncbi:ABC transporter permease [Fictibacillus norfolkensis]|uniref:Iron ABC transporter permease n=1 Tax=Fictibacillus norfolkensis TaxID=2762233 RepID=A0ABR8SJ67_9BACL|nr:ABC transporter permease subunit [Fictibacillus norfolkensis]MBD7963531.1 iron ABC transporter permease [Fictibacillus norfolkensis]